MNSNIDKINSPALVKESLKTKVFYVVRRWPVIPILILSIMVFIAVFAPLISPMGPKEINLRGHQ